MANVKSIAHEKLAADILRGFKGKITGDNSDYIVGENPENRYFVGKLLPVSDSQTSSWGSDVFIESIGADFYIEQDEIEAAQLIVYPKGDFGWFKALLEMEALNSGEANANSKEVSISFSTVEREQGTKRTLILKHPNRYIPQFMEDLADIPLVLHMGDQTKTVAIEVVNIKSYTLRVKMKNSADIQGIDLSCVTAATIDAKSPAFLIDELRKQFIDFGYEDDLLSLQAHTAHFLR